MSSTYHDRLNQIRISYPNAYDKWNEFDEHCAATLQAAVVRDNTKTKVIHADIKTIDPRTLISEIG